MACRRDHRPQLQSVPRGNLLDRIRLETIMLISEHSCPGPLKPSVLSTRHVNSEFHLCFTCSVTICAAQLALKRDPMTAQWPAGATTVLNCSLCQAGTYMTGSGRQPICRFCSSCASQTNPPIRSSSTSNSSCGFQGLCVSEAFRQIPSCQLGMYVLTETINASLIMCAVTSHAGWLL